MEAVLDRENLMQAYRRVVANKGAPGVDGMKVTDLGDFIREKWPEIREALKEDRYEPQPVLKVEIPKPGGKGMRMLGIPVVLDRLVEQALLQVLGPIFDPGFSEYSFGFRPRRSAHDALEQARKYVRQGLRWVVDIDLEKFFDRVNHDLIMAKIQCKVKDKTVLHLIRRYLRAGMLVDGVVEARREGTPQGGPLSPLLSNIMLDELDKELEKRGHKFCRYADDCNIYLRSRKAAERVMESITRFIEKKLKLKVNRDKSRVAPTSEVTFLGHVLNRSLQTQLLPSLKAIKRLRLKLKEIFRRGRGRNLQKLIEQEINPLLRGWVAYFRLCKALGVLKTLDSWIRRHLKKLLWRRWKKPKTKAKKLIARGLDEHFAWTSACNRYGPWWNGGAKHMNIAFPISYFTNLGLISMSNYLKGLQSAS
jgi:group II intron reverse transcriptase/maturase